MKHFCFIFIISIIGPGLAQTGGIYQEMCDSETPCDSNALLACKNGYCDCLEQAAYDSSRKKCVILAGELCLQARIEVVNGSKQVTRKITKLDCVPHAYCNNDGFCGCLEGYNAEMGGVCTKVSQYWGKCKNNSTCDMYANSQLVCLNGTCSCNPIESDFFSIYCVAKAGIPSGNYSNYCTRNSSPRRSYDEKSKSYIEICQCNKGFFKSKNGYCNRDVDLVKAGVRAGYGDHCDDCFPCDIRANLACTNGSCKCLKSDEMSYEEASRRCLVLAGKRCSSNTAIQMFGVVTPEKNWTEKFDCVKGAECKDDGYCGCTGNFYETTEGLCAPKLTFFENCTRDVECIRIDNYDLICLNGTCNCNETDGRCGAKADVEYNKYKNCTRNAEGGWRFNSEIGRVTYVCECISGSSKTSDGRCLSPYGHPCDNSINPCSTHLICVNGTCNCHFPSFQRHHLDSTSAGKCISRIGGPCSEGINGKLHNFSCDGNAVCVESDGLKECRCPEGFIQSGKNKCGLHSKSYGSPCKTDSECDQTPEATLKCYNETCSCGDFQVYDEALNKCRGLVGADCHFTHSSEFCIENAFCKFNRYSEREGTCRCRPNAKGNSSRRCVRTSKWNNESSEKF